MSEKQQIKDKKLNVILYGLNEEQIDNHTEIANEVITLLNPEIVQHNTVRLGKSRLVKITFKNEADRLSVLRNSKSLKRHHLYSKIYVNPDLTPEQLASSKKLREDLKQHRMSHPQKIFIIRSGAVVEIPDRKKDARNNTHEVNNIDGTPLTTNHIQDGRGSFRKQRVK